MHDEAVDYGYVSRAHLVTQDAEGNFIAYPREDEIILSRGASGHPERQVRVVTGQWDKVVAVYPETLDGVVGDHVTLRREDLRETNKGLVVDFAIVEQSRKIAPSQNMTA